jgi:hypothetical protein
VYDVRNLNPDTHGYFDVVLCAGILYHLDAPDAIDFLQKVSAVCVRTAIVDTHISLQDEVSVDCNGRNYQGRFTIEHDSGASSSPLTNSNPELDRPREPDFVNTDPVANAAFDGGFGARIRRSVAEAHPKKAGLPHPRSPTTMALEVSVICGEKVSGRDFHPLTAILAT